VLLFLGVQTDLGVSVTKDIGKIKQETRVQGKVYLYTLGSLCSLMPYQMREVAFRSSQ